ncbi:Enoyl-CoA hydratase [Patulibacter medicamentivorans]|jgi:enoyl-CoA hydratase/carnithine racemase|uniref:enoyl-CoA hydratase n=1 Tax=Patulibacter medicamentivorans TaxID=1097667 RepID=H0E0B6_9ACTN|nr:enoyl-CoA hydratase-related protein [Patulibacter medicamentivorans]EHN12919.1 Enoyl-CoA hydratase [Patulibacter medicamentivorans]
MSPDERSAVRRSNPRDGVALLTLDRAASRNVLDDELRDGLIAALEATDADADVRAVVLTGGSEVFAAGADIRAMRDQGFQDAIAARGARLWGRLAAVRKPLIAAVAGPAVGGGCELALACDLVVAADTAEFSQPEVRLGIIPGGGGTQRLARTLGKHRAMDLVLTGRRVSAEEAQRLGFVNRVVAAERLQDAALELAETIARRPAIAVQLAKRAVLAADETSLGAGLAVERELFLLAMASDDRREGMAAFLERRPPRFTGR